MPIVTIIVPSYRHGRYLRRALADVQAQTFQDWEALVIDDGSDDDSVAIATEFAASDSRFRVYVNEQNLGTYGTQQRGVQMATGQYIAILNSDDRWEPEKLSHQVTALDIDPEARFCYTFGRQIDEEDHEQPGDVHAHWPRGERQVLLPYLLYENRVLASSVLFRREGLRFETSCRYSGDWVALLEQSARGPARCIPESLVSWRQHSHNTYRLSYSQMCEEVRVRWAIERAADHWREFADPDWVRYGLTQNALNLVAGHIFLGDSPGARRAARILVSYSRSRVALRRAAAAWLPIDRSRSHLWGPAHRANPLPKDRDRVAMDRLNLVLR